MSYTPSPSPPATPATSDSECESTNFSNIPQFASGSFISTNPAHPHPFAASAKANRPPPSYEKRTPPTTPPDPKRFVFFCREPTRNPDVVARVARPSYQRSLSLADREQQRWDVAIASAVDKAETKLDMSNACLTYIPSSIIDLKDLVVLSNKQPSASISTRKFVRSTTAPALLPSSHVRPFVHSYTTNRLGVKPTGRQVENVWKPAADCNGCELELYLMRNAIRMLPRELFALDCLVVLSLRQNKLTSMPPAICKLVHLRELNIANNRLSHLPAEIQDLRLVALHLYPNPFITPPPSVGDQQMHRTRRTRTLGPLKRGPSIPTLSELALRRLLSPASPASHKTVQRPETCLEDSMSLAEIDALMLPVHIKRIIHASTGHGRARLTEEGTSVDAESDMSRNVCPCPRHYGMVGSGAGAKKCVRFVQNGQQVKRGLFDHNAPVFRVPVEERMEWVGTVAGVQVAESPGAWIPLLWRGCGPGCLDFLEDGDEIDDCTFETGTGEGDEEFQFSDGE